MCVLCGTPDPSHDLLLVRLAVLSGGGGFILMPRRWIRRMRAGLRRALRFARVLRYRPDKRPDEADTIETVRAFGEV